MARRTTLQNLIESKAARRPIAMLTCYDYATARALNGSGVDALLVGDSAAQVVLGHPSTLPVGMDLMVALTAAVRRGAPDVCLVADMPFLSYQTGYADAIRNAGRFLAETDCDLVKVEVNLAQADLVEAIADAGIPVMAHIGFRPQSAARLGTPVQARSSQAALDLLYDAEAMIKAGAAALLLECVTAEAAEAITQRSTVPVISCGSGPHCDGQVLVLHDVLGWGNPPALRFAKRYAELDNQITLAAQTYAEDVHAGRFPDDEHSFHLPRAAVEQFRRDCAEVEGRLADEEDAPA